MWIIKNAVGGYFIGYQKDAKGKNQPCFMFEHGGEQEMPITMFHTLHDAEFARKALLKMKHNAYIVDIS